MTSNNQNAIHCRLRLTRLSQTLVGHCDNAKLGAFEGRQKKKKDLGLKSLEHRKFPPFSTLKY